MSKSHELRSLQKALRRIVRSLDIQSRKIDREFGLTLPQLVVLQCVRDLGQVTSKAISEQASLSPPTVVGILDNLDAKGMIERYRSAQDRRIVYTRLTSRGQAVLAEAPSPIGESFDTRFCALPDETRTAIVASFAEVAALCEAGLSIPKDGKQVKI